MVCLSVSTTQPDGQDNGAVGVFYCIVIGGRCIHFSLRLSEPGRGKGGIDANASGLSRLSH